MVFRYEKDGNQIRVSVDRAEELGAIPSKTDWERVDSLTDDEITAAIILDPDQPALSEEELRQFLDRLRRLNDAKRSAAQSVEPALSEDGGDFEDKD